MSGTDLELVAQIVDIRTGEIVPATDANRVADILKHLKDYRTQIGHAIRQCETALIETSKERGTKTLHLDGVEVQISGGPALQWDVEILEELSAAGLPDDRYTELVTIEQTYKVNASVAKSIAASNPVYAEIVERARSYQDKPMYVRVK